MNCNPFGHDEEVKSALASLYTLVGTTLEKTKDGSCLEPRGVELLKSVIREERERVSGSSLDWLRTARRILKTLGLHLLSREINTFVESDNDKIFECLFSQAELFIDRYGRPRPSGLEAVAISVAPLQKEIAPRYAFHQLPCTASTTARRLELLRKYLDDHSRVLFIGDDDFVSVGLALMVPNEITVIDIDPRIVGVIGKVSKERHLSIQCQVADIRKVLPQGLYGSADVVFTDPTYGLKPMLRFLSVAASCLRRTSGAHLLGCCSPVLTASGWDTVKRWAGSQGLVVKEYLSGFNEYPKTSLMRLGIKILERLAIRSAVARACAGIPFVYSDIVVFHPGPNE